VFPPALWDAVMWVNSGRDVALARKTQSEKAVTMQANLPNPGLCTRPRPRSTKQRRIGLFHVHTNYYLSLKTIGGGIPGANGGMG
jgi:hypothetical protein